MTASRKLSLLMGDEDTFIEKVVPVKPVQPVKGPSLPSLIAAQSARDRLITMRENANPSNPARQRRTSARERSEATRLRQAAPDFTMTEIGNNGIDGYFRTVIDGDTSDVIDGLFREDP